jgi:hypothetical protein
MTTKRTRRVVRVGGSSATSTGMLDTDSHFNADASSKPGTGQNKKPRTGHGQGDAAPSNPPGSSAQTNSAVAPAERDPGPPLSQSEPGKDNPRLVPGLGCMREEATFKLHARIAEQQAHIDELLAIRLTDPERTLEEYKRLAEAELTAREKACNLYRAEAGRLDQELRHVSADAKQGLRRERARNEALLQELESLRSANGAGQAALDRPADHEQAPTQGRDQVARADPGPVPGLTTGTQVSPDRSATQAPPNATSENVACLKLLQQLTGITRMEQWQETPDHASSSVVVTIENPLDSRRICFKLSSEANSQFCYEPVECNMPDAPPSAFFHESLDFDQRNAPALYRQLLAYVFEKKAKDVEPSKAPEEAS